MLSSFWFSTCNDLMVCLKSMDKWSRKRWLYVHLYNHRSFILIWKLSHFISMFWMIKNSFHASTGWCEWHRFRRLHDGFLPHCHAGVKKTVLWTRACKYNGPNKLFHLWNVPGVCEFSWFVCLHFYLVIAICHRQSSSLPGESSAKLDKPLCCCHGVIRHGKWK